MKTIRENIWLWGQTVGSHHAVKHYNLPGVNEMDSAEGCRFFNLDNCFRVAMGAGPFPPFDNESEKIKDIGNVVWSAVGSGSVQRCNEGLGDLPEVLRQAEMYPNISGAILDDFFKSVEGFQNGGSVARHPLGNVEKMREMLHNFPNRRLDLWLVLYTYQFEMPIKEYLPLFDYITLWTWKGQDLLNWRENLKKLMDMAPDIPRYAGCYLWDYGGRKLLPPELMKFQLDEYYKAIKAGELNGIIICSNCCTDVELTTVDIMKEWINTHGNECINQ